MIKIFKSNNKCGCFSNSYPCSVKCQKMDFDISKAVYQSMKTLDMSEREKFIGLDRKEAKNLAERVPFVRIGRQLNVRLWWVSILRSFRRIRI